MSQDSSTTTILIISALDLLMSALAAALGLLVIFSASGGSNAGAGELGSYSFGGWAQLEFSFSETGKRVTCSKLGNGATSSELVPTSEDSYITYRVEDIAGLVVQCRATPKGYVAVYVHTPKKIDETPIREDCKGTLLVSYTVGNDVKPDVVLECVHG